MPAVYRLPLERFYHHEATQPRRPWLVQPFADGQVETLDWQAVGDQVRRAATWLLQRNLPAGSMIAILSKNCAHWLIADLAIWMAGHVSVPLYPNLTAESVDQVLTHSGAKWVFVGKLDDWPAMAPGIPLGVQCISLPICPPGRFDFIWAQLQACAPLTDSPQPGASQLATLIYTSGTTGQPKGVMHTFASLAFVASEGGQLFTLTDRDRLFSYLPLCHVAERMVVEMNGLYSGATVFFAESLESFLADLRRARPTVLFGVPRIWGKLQMGVYGRIDPGRLDFLLGLPLIGRRTGRRVLTELGLDQLRVALSGAAPVPASLLDWYRRLGLEVQEVYGMTEGCGYSHVGRTGLYREGYIGPPCPGVEVRIASDGEVQVFSPALMRGYYKEPIKTAEALTNDGYLRTGDKGEQDSEGRLRLTGRLKEIFKTSKGKYVAPAPIENHLAAHPRIEQVCVVGEGLAAPLALCVLSAEGRAEAAGSGRGALEKSLAAVLEQTNASLDRHERLHRLIVVKDSWAVDNGFLTPTLKIRRAAIEAAYGEYFAAWSDGPGAVAWWP